MKESNYNITLKNIVRDSGTCVAVVPLPDSGSRAERSKIAKPTLLRSGWLSRLHWRASFYYFVRLPCLQHILDLATVRWRRSAPLS